MFIKSDSAFDAVHIGQQTIVKSPAAAQPPPLQIKPHAGNQHQIQPVQWNLNAFRARFADAELPGHNFASQILHPAGDVTIACGIKAGQGGDFSRRQRLLQQRPHIRFIRQRRKKQNRSGIFPNGLFLEPVANLRGQRVACRRGNCLQRAADLFSQRGLGLLNFHFHPLSGCAGFGLWTLDFELFEFRAPFFDPLLDFLFHALLGRLVITLVRAEIILRDKMSGMVVRVFVALAVAQPFRAG